MHKSSKDDAWWYKQGINPVNEDDSDMVCSSVSPPPKWKAYKSPSLGRKSHNIAKPPSKSITPTKSPAKNPARPSIHKSPLRTLRRHDSEGSKKKERAQAVPVAFSSQSVGAWKPYGSKSKTRKPEKKILDSTHSAPTNFSDLSQQYDFLDKKIGEVRAGLRSSSPPIKSSSPLRHSSADHQSSPSVLRLNSSSLPEEYPGELSEEEEEDNHKNDATDWLRSEAQYVRASMAKKLENLDEEGRTPTFSTLSPKSSSASQKTCKRDGRNKELTNRDSKSPRGWRPYTPPSNAAWVKEEKKQKMKAQSVRSLVTPLSKREKRKKDPPQWKPYSSKQWTTPVKKLPVPRSRRSSLTTDPTKSLVPERRRRSSLPTMPLHPTKEVTPKNIYDEGRRRARSKISRSIKNSDTDSPKTDVKSPVSNHLEVPSKTGLEVHKKGEGSAPAGDPFFKPQKTPTYGCETPTLVSELSKYSVQGLKEHVESMDNDVLSSCATLLHENDINGTLLSVLSQTELKDIGLSFGQRRSIQLLRESNDNLVFRSRTAAALRQTLRTYVPLIDCSVPAGQIKTRLGSMMTQSGVALLWPLIQASAPGIGDFPDDKSAALSRIENMLNF